MRRFIALILVVPALSLLNSDPRRHVHVYPDHGPHRHQHGPAVHEHPHEGHHAGGTQARLRFEDLDPDDHVLVVRVISSPARGIVAVDVEIQGVPADDTVLLFTRTTLPIEVRVHGPPGSSTNPLRAPPSPTA